MAEVKGGIDLSVSECDNPAAEVVEDGGEGVRPSWSVERVEEDLGLCTLAGAHPVFVSSTAALLQLQMGQLSAGPTGL